MSSHFDKESRLKSTRTRNCIYLFYNVIDVTVVLFKHDPQRREYIWTSTQYWYKRNLQTIMCKRTLLFSTVKTSIQYIGEI